MSESPATDNAGTSKVIDEEGDVDRKIKERILNSREAVNTNENILFTERLISPEINISQAQATIAWGHSVRRYIRDVEVLLTDPSIPNSKHYYKGVDLGEMTLIPPDRDGYEFSKFASEQFDDKMLKKEMGLPFDCDAPKPETVSFEGLVSLLEVGDVVGHTWEFYVEKRGARQNWKPMTLRVTEPVRKDIYERAVRLTDQFLQQAGIGMRTGMPEVDDESEPW